MTDSVPFKTQIQRVVLVGFMCSGKSTVGEALADRLGWDFLDFDVEIERRENRTVARIIEGDGEDYFRSLEAALTREAGHRDHLVMAPGGGWILDPTLLESIRPGTLSVWLQVTPEETVRRLMADDVERPLRHQPNALAVIAEMMAEREALYAHADLAVATDGMMIEEVVDAILNFEF